MTDYEDVHRRAEELAKTWYEDEKERADALKEIIMKELHHKGYWHIINLEKVKNEAPIIAKMIKDSNDASKCLCEKLKALFK